MRRETSGLCTKTVSARRPSRLRQSTAKDLGLLERGAAVEACWLVRHAGRSARQNAAQQGVELDTLLIADGQA